MSSVSPNADTLPPPTEPPPPDLLAAARRAYLQLTRYEQAEFWRWIRSGEADDDRKDPNHGD